MTYKVRSLGMWLKLETGMLLMLLLFSVLGGRRLNKNYIGGAVEWKNSSKSLVSPLSLPLFESPPPLIFPLSTLFVASHREYNTSFHTDGNPSHLPHTSTAMHANVCAQA